MKNIIILTVFLIGCLGELSAQVVMKKSAAEGTVSVAQSKRYPLNWSLLSYSSDSVFGIEVNKACELLKGKEKKKKVVVAVIDSGCDDQHEDLKDALWVNEDEIPGNGIDDDGNGYVDDVFGWNFLANTKGVDVQNMPEAGALEFVKRKARLDELHSKKRNNSEDAEYRKLKELLMSSKLGVTYASLLLTGQMMECFKNVVVPEFEKQYTPEQRTFENFQKLTNTVSPTDTLKAYTLMIYAMRWQMGKSDWQKMVATFDFSHKMSEKNFEAELAAQVNERLLIGDNPGNIKDNRYGTPVLSTASAGHGTHVGSIIGAVRDNDLGLDGIADAKLMFIRAIPGTGDVYDKDVALAIRYAVDNGADIINMSFGKRVTTHKKWLDEALQYAEKKGVLIVHAAGDNYSNTDKDPFYPVKYMASGKEISSFITVGASDPQGEPVVTSNYGKNSVDVFAPGVDIFGAIPGDNYKKNSGTDMAAPMVSGLAALIMTYYPELSAGQVKDVILKSAVLNRDAMVRLPVSTEGSTKSEKVSFRELCVGGGIVSAFTAVQLAEELNRK